MRRWRRPPPSPPWDSLPGVLWENLWREQLRSENNPKDYPVRAGKFYTNKVRERKWAHHKNFNKITIPEVFSSLFFLPDTWESYPNKKFQYRLTVGMLFCSRSKITEYFRQFFFSENLAEKFLHAFIAVCFNKGNTIVSVYWTAFDNSVHFF